MTVTITGQQLVTALHEALARLQEYESLDDKLAVYDLSVPSLEAVLTARWSVYSAEFGKALAGDRHHLLVRGFIEGLLTGLQLRAPS